MTVDPHAHALELRRLLMHLHTASDGSDPATAADIAAAELALFTHLRDHRATLGRTYFWSGYYAELDDFDRRTNR
ncbi:hypothetical protein [Nocardia paucivorans]|uniref:hypothetical protein n=1 Tax=Nocardia paucivorans TaxID=114259 RepID=UPI0002DBCA20|nr:hypothetical protein [Nocardia paucivorans]